MAVHGMVADCEILQVQDHTPDLAGIDHRF